MCRLHTSVHLFLSSFNHHAHHFYSEGTMYGCGHYIITRKVAKEDCQNRWCVNSVKHPQNGCGACPNCKRYYDPDASETITGRSTEYCHECEYWFKGHGARHRGK
ncbi:hypothetical protein CPC08DRAFT_82584 [Agrocybe pediades]|nr:hypothetical protein CPC08DRAFT_82584 [Agrocybe pediades]